LPTRGATSSSLKAHCCSPPVPPAATSTPLAGPRSAGRRVARPFTAIGSVSTSAATITYTERRLCRGEGQGLISLWRSRQCIGG
jgi:hypothetical protein